MRFLVDNQLPFEVAQWLTRRGCDAVHVLDRGQGQVNDRKIWEAGIHEDRIVVSKDEDFFLLATRPADSGRLLWVRLGNCRTSALLTRLENAWPDIEEAFSSGQRIVEWR